MIDFASNSATPAAPLLALAPMQDVTDVAFMRTLAQLGSDCLPDFFITPYFRSTSTTCAMSESPLACILENPAPQVPVWAQLAGSEPAPLVRDARELLRLPIAGINLNAGCPSPLVNRHGAGAALLRELPRLREVCLALREVTPAGRFSIKCRLGWESAEEFAAVLQILAEAQPDMVVVHARTRRALYGGEPQWTAAAQAVSALTCPVLLNGDICAVHEGQRLLQAYHPAGLACGRGVVRDAYFFRRLRCVSPGTSREELRRYYAILMEETGRALRRYTPAGHCNRMKKYLAYCYADLTPEQEHTLRRCTDPEVMSRVLQSESFTTP